MPILVKIAFFFFFVYLTLLVLATLGIYLRANFIRQTYKNLENDNEDFSNIGVTREFVEYVWEETKKAYPEAVGLEIPKVYFTRRNPSEFGFSNVNLLGVFNWKELAIVIFPEQHLLFVSFALTGWWTDKVDDLLGYMAVTLVHEFRHYILHAQKVLICEQHSVMRNDEVMFRAMLLVASRFSPYGKDFVNQERKYLKEFS